MTIIIHDHGAPEPVVTVVEDPVHLVAVVDVPPPAPPPTVKEVAAAAVEFAAVVDKKKSP